MTFNDNVYNSEKVIRHYARQNHLQKPEQSILNQLADQLAAMRMLDVGVGGGRTTRFFLPLVAEYTGIDASPGMINSCLEQFPASATVRFEVCNVLALDAFSSASFDLVLFSFNGIDYIPSANKLEVLRSLRRICRPGGYTVFSSHNLLALPELFRYRFRLHPIKLFKNLIGCYRLRARYKGILASIETLNETNILDDVYDFGLDICYIRPAFQIEMLKRVGFTEVICYNQEGRALSDQEIGTDNSPWIYYLCR